MPTDRAIVVHSADQMRAAVRAAGRHGAAVTIISAPDAAAFLGPALFRAMIDRATTTDRSPDSIRFVLDCGGDAGLALAAFRVGVPWVRVTLPAAVLAKVAEIGRALGGRIAEDIADLPSLDLADRNDAAEACAAWLDATRTPPTPDPAPSCHPGERRVSQSWA